MKRFEAKSVLITGAASGIGAACARRFAAEGANLALGDQNQSGLGELTDELERAGCGVASMALDVADQGQIEALVALSADRFGGLDVLVNNAGIGSFGKTPDLESDAWRHVIDVDLHAVFYGCRAGIRLMRDGGGGAIVNTASVSGLFGDYGFGAYNAAKGAVVNYTRALALDHGGEGIRVNAVCPGLIETPLSAGLFTIEGFTAKANAAIPMGRTGRASEVASAVAFLASDDASYITGAMLVIDGGVTAATGQVNFTRIVEEAFPAPEPTKD